MTEFRKTIFNPDSFLCGVGPAF